MNVKGPFRLVSSNRETVPMRLVQPTIPQNRWDWPGKEKKKILPILTSDFIYITKLTLILTTEKIFIISDYINRFSPIKKKKKNTFLDAVLIKLP